MKNIKVMLFSSFLPQNNFFLLLWDVRHRQECVDWSNSSRARRTWILKRGHPRGARATLGVPGAPSLYVRVKVVSHDISITQNFAISWKYFLFRPKIISTWYPVHFGRIGFRRNMSTCYSHKFQESLHKISTWQPSQTSDVPNPEKKKFHQPTCRHFIPEKWTYFWFSFQG